jgi:NAD(P)-dependent dehydrogenase (short-subunit alcohol dehydrogenase family)
VQTFTPGLLQGKTAFIAGGTSGINLGIAHGLIAVGATVAVISRKQDKVDSAVAELSATGGQALGWATDVRDYAAVEDCLSKAHDAWGPIDIVVSGAAGNFLAPAVGMSANAFKTVIDIDLMGTFHVLRASHQFLRKPGASVISITAG